MARDTRNPPLSEHGAWLFSVGDRVAMRGSHPWKGEAGEIVNSPGKVFNGWNVRLDNGHCVGAADHHMTKLDKREQ